VSIREKALGANNPAAAEPLNSLALICYREGRYTEAEPLFRRVMVIRAAALGWDHPLVRQCLKQYAAVLRALGRGAEAAKVEARIRAIPDAPVKTQHTGRSVNENAAGRD
jgi:hypothetical protein